MQYDFNLSPNGGQRVEVVGRFFKYARGQGAIRVTTSKGGYVDLLPGQGVWGTEFSSLTVNDRSGLANAGVLLAGEFDFRDQSIPGVVSVADGSAAKTLLLNCFMGGAMTSGAVTYNSVSLLNPAGSGKLTIIKKVMWQGAGLGSLVRLFIVNAGYVQGGQSTAAKNARNKLSGAANSVSTIAGDQSASLPPGGWGEALIDMTDADGNAPRIYKFDDPVILKPGAAAVFSIGQANNGLAKVDFEFSEEGA